MKKVMVFGTFDGLHDGHLNFFRQAKMLGDELIVVVAKTANVKRIKGKKPRFSENQRLEAVKAVKTVKIAILGQIRDHYAVIKKLKPRIIALGYDQHSFDGNLKKLFPEIKIIRLKPYRAEFYKSSLLNKIS